MLEFAIKLDWLTLTKKGFTHSDDGAQDRARLLFRLHYECGVIGVDTTDFEIVRGDGFYDLHVLYRRGGVRASASFDIEKQGFRVVMSGKALVGETLPVRILSSAIDNDWKPTRIDIALDMFNTDVTVEKWYWEYMSVHSENKQRSVDYRRRASGDMLTIGSRESEKYARIYDKAAEQGLSNDWVRFEIEYKGWAAIGIVPKILADLRSTSMLHVAMVSLPHFWLAQYIESFAQGEHIKIDPKLRTKDGRAQWLEGVVAKTLAKMKVFEPEDYAEVMDWVEVWAQGFEIDKENPNLL